MMSPTVPKKILCHPRLGASGGFSLVELIVGLAIIMVMFPSSIIVFQQVLQNKTIAEARITCVNLAQMVLEHETQKRFSAVDTIRQASFEDPNITVVQEGGAEDPPAPNPYRDTTLVHEFINYRFEVDVSCVWGGAAGLNNLNLDTWAPDAGCSGRSGELKRVIVRVRNPLADTVQLTTLVTDTRDPV